MKSWRDIVAAACGWVAAAFLAAMMLLTVVDVALRAFLSIPIRGTFELVELLLACTFFFAVPASFLREEHIVVDILDARYPRAVPRIKRFADVLAVAVLATIAWQSWISARDAMAFGDVTSDLALPRILYWIPVVVGIAGGAAAAAAMALKRTNGQ